MAGVNAAHLKGNALGASNLAPVGLGANAGGVGNPLGFHLGSQDLATQGRSSHNRGLVIPTPPGTRGRRSSNVLSGSGFFDAGSDPDPFGSQSSRGANSRGTQRLEYKRVDQVWDSQIHNYKLQDTTEGTNSVNYDGFLFHVRRTFDWEGKYKTTIVDVKSKALREVLQDVMGNIKGVSLVEETPKLDPNMLFL